MTFENDNRLKLFKDNLPEFVAQIDPKEILPYLPCLTLTAQQEISCCQDNSGARKAMFTLFQRLPQMDNWWEDLTAALRRSDINKPQLADLIDPSVKNYTNNDVRIIGCCSGDPSPTSRLLTDWSTRPNSTLSNLLTALRNIGRLDLISDIEAIVFPHQDDEEVEREDDGQHGLSNEQKPEIIYSRQQVSSTLSTTSQKYQEEAEQDDGELNSNVIPNVIYQADKDLGKIHSSYSETVKWEAIQNETSSGRILSKLLSFGPWVLAGSCIVPIALYFATRKQ